jgi:hypothetical protein
MQGEGKGGSSYDRCRLSLPLITTLASQWTLAQLRHRLFAEGKEDKPLWARVSDLVILTLLTLAEVRSGVWGKEVGLSAAAAGGSSSGQNDVYKPALFQDLTPNESCFELYGIDILVDENMRPWLLEVCIRHGQ